MRAALALAAALALVAALAPGSALAAPGSARAAHSSRVVRYHDYRLVVPARWPVYRLRMHSTVCVRFDRHAVYLGQPPSAQRCPSSPAGRTEAILVQPRGARSGPSPDQVLPLPATRRAARGRQTAARITARRVVVTATWNRHPAVIRSALGIRSLATAADRSAAPRRSAVARARALTRHDARRRAASVTHATRSRARAAATSRPGEVYTGAGFDACHTPSPSQMAAWGSSPYRGIGVYIGGANMACSQPNLTPAWVSQQSADGWHLIPIYVGLQAPSNSCGCAAMSPSAAVAAQQGQIDAEDAVADAQAIGLGAGNPLYLDMEGYTRTAGNTAAVLAFEQAWTEQLHAEGYRSGIYSSENSGIVDLVNSYGTGYVEPDNIWIASWNGQRSTADARVPADEWAAHQRMHQYQGGHNETYAGVTINIDGDYLDAATAAAGTGTGTGVAAAPSPAPTPSLGVRPAADGSTKLHPSWLYATGVSSWQLFAGQSPTALVPLGSSVGAGTHRPIVSHTAYPYYAVTALGPSGQPLASSTPVATPAHLSIFGHTVFVPRRGLAGVPVGCFHHGACRGVTVTITRGRTTLVRTGRQRIPAGSGLAYFKLTSAQRARLWRARHHEESATIAVHGGPGFHARRKLRLAGFSTSGHTPRHRLRQSPALHFLGTADFVSHGWVGGILARCVSASPCQATTQVVAHHQTIATARAQTLEVGETGYLLFKLTPAGHLMLRQARGNKLAVTVKLTSGGVTATGHLVLSAYS